MRKTPALLVRGVCALAGVLFLTPVLALPGCGGANQYALTGIGPAASADVNIHVEETDMGNKMVKVDVKHLPPPNRIHADATVYVVWFVAKGQPAQKAGRLQYDEDERAGKTAGTTSYETFTVLITAEESEGAAQPSKHVVARQEDAE